MKGRSAPVDSAWIIGEECDTGGSKGHVAALAERVQPRQSLS